MLATWLGSGESRLLHPLDPGPAGDEWLLAQAREAAIRDQSRTVDGAGGPVFLRVFNPPVRLVVVGGVHVAQALAPMARLAGYDVLVVDPRRSFAAEDRFRGVELSREWPDEAMARLGVDRRTAVVTMTHDPKIDDPALAAALSGAFDEKVHLMSYEVVLGPDGESLEWIERSPAGETRHTAEPGIGFFRALGIGILSLFPIDGML